ncbi:MAG: MATE family efflux transporter [Gemmataceae bacterium]
MTRLLRKPAEHPVTPGRPAWPLVLTLAWPALLQNWLSLAVMFTDRLLAGRFQDLDAADQTATQAAQTTANYLAWVLLSYTTLVTIGATALVARLVGGGDLPGARRVLHQALVLAVVLGVVGTAAGLALLPPALGLLQLGEPASSYAADYLRPLLYALPLQMAGAAGVACLAGAGDTRAGLWVLGGVTLLNVPMAWGFFFLRGFAGIAVGTAVSQALGGVVVLLVLCRGRAGLRLSLEELRPDRNLLRRLLHVSVPAAIDSLSMQAGYLCFLGIVNRLGHTAAAAHGVALMWEALGYQSGAAFGTAALTVVGQHLGAGQPRRAARGGWTAFGLGAAAMSLMGLVFFSLARPMFALFNPHPGQGAIIEAGVPALRLIAFAMPALAACMILAKALQGAGDTRGPMLFTWVGFFGVRIPLAYWLTAGGWGLVGAWLAMAADLHVRGLCVLLRFARGRWKSTRV